MKSKLSTCWTYKNLNYHESIKMIRKLLLEKNISIKFQVRKGEMPIANEYGITLIPKKIKGISSRIIIDLKIKGNHK